jgi:hypothetical protein
MPMTPTKQACQYRLEDIVYIAKEYGVLEPSDPSTCAHVVKFANQSFSDVKEEFLQKCLKD